jgi:hypothetical protein
MKLVLEYLLGMKDFDPKSTGNPSSFLVLYGEDVEEYRVDPEE